jgi:uncharacterized protein with von Willebrand factor type A (vWA) domain
MTIKLTMTGKEIKAALEEALTEQSASQSLLVEGKGAAREPEASGTVLALDRWGQRKGAELRERWLELGSMIETPAEAEQSALVAADAHGALFEPEPAFAANPSDKARAAWWKQMMETPEFAALHNQTCLDSGLSEIGAKSLADQWTTYANEQPPKDPSEPEQEPGSDGESIEQSIARIRSTTEALKQATENIKDAKDAAEGLGMGAEGQPLDAAALTEAFRTVRDSPQLRDIMRMAGRMRLLAQALQRTKAQHGRDDVVGVELGGDLSRLVPSELAQLASGIPELELVALDRLARRLSLCRQYQGVERLGQGPIVVVVDESGSMDREVGGVKKIVAAKALALTLAWLARQQRRWIALVGFAGGTTGTRIAFPPGKMDQARLIEWLVHFYGGGTVLDVPMRELPEVYWREFEAQGLAHGKTDVVIITDAIVRCDDRLRDAYLKWASAEEVTTYGIVLASDAGDLAQVCNRHWCIPSLDLGSEAVEGVLSI